MRGGGGWAFTTPSCSCRVLHPRPQVWTLGQTPASASPPALNTHTREACGQGPMGQVPVASRVTSLPLLAAQLRDTQDRGRPAVCALVLTWAQSGRSGIRARLRGVWFAARQQEPNGRPPHSPRAAASGCSGCGLNEAFGPGANRGEVSLHPPCQEAVPVWRRLCLL